MKQLLYGVAYYDEYMPYDRLNQDIQMMKAAGINVVRIAESTWSTLEPRKGEFHFYHIDRVIDAMEKAEIKVIIGTPTYAIPSWLAMEEEDILATTRRGKEIYGRRQNMDITSPTYLFYAERVIRKLIEHVAGMPCVIGYQLDNETKHYDTSGKHVQEMFKDYLVEKFKTVENLNKEFGLAYWSNSLGKWDDLPNVLGTINGSLGAEFDKFRRNIVTKFLTWQSELVNEYKREDQFVTHNFDFDWSAGYSYGVQPDVNHFTAAKCLTIAGTDIYHPTQDELTGSEIAFAGDIIRSLKQDNYLVLETEAQGFKDWLPYEGQLRLQAFSHVASGANMVAYWHWHSIHNAAETYWKGLLSHDLTTNPTYEEAKRVGREFAELSPHLVNLKKKNKVAVLVSNESLTSLNWFPIDKDLSYNNVFRWVYDALYEMNVECNILFPESQGLKNYELIVAPALYSAPDTLLNQLKEYVNNGGHLLTTFKSGFANEYVTVSYEQQPHILSECCGVTYNQFTNPKNVSLTMHQKEEMQGKAAKVSYWMELLKPTTAEIIASYDHKHWSNYAAITKNRYGKGSALYIGCYFDKDALKTVLADYLKEINLDTEEQKYQWPVIIRKGYNQSGKRISFYFNYSDEEVTVTYEGNDGRDLIAKQPVKKGQTVKIPAWNFLLTEELNETFSEI